MRRLRQLSLGELRGELHRAGHERDPDRRDEIHEEFKDRLVGCVVRAFMLFKAEQILEEDKAERRRLCDLFQFSDVLMHEVEQERLSLDEVVEDILKKLLSQGLTRKVSCEDAALPPEEKGRRAVEFWRRFGRKFLLSAVRQGDDLDVVRRQRKEQALMLEGLGGGGGVVCGKLQRLAVDVPCGVPEDSP